MTKAKAITPNISGNFTTFTDPQDGCSHVITKVEAKEADGKRRGAHETPASPESLQKLLTKFNSK